MFSCGSATLKRFVRMIVDGDAMISVCIVVW